MELTESHMTRTHTGGSKDDRARAEDIARMLLTYAELPLVIRINALMILDCSEFAGYVEWAQEAVRIAELAIENVRIPMGKRLLRSLGCETAVLVEDLILIFHPVLSI